MAQGLYIIKNKINSKFYIGSSININKRWIVHRSTLNGQSHCNQHLQNAWNKYGETNFDFRTIKVIDGDYETLLRVEQEYLDLVFKVCSDRIYNIARRASGGNGHIVTDEMKEATSLRNRKFSDEQMEEIKKMYESGMTQKAIAEKTKSSKTTINLWINRMCDEGKLRKPADIRKEKVLALYNQGKTQKEISKVLGISASSVCQLVKHGKYIY